MVVILVCISSLNLRETETFFSFKLSICNPEILRALLREHNACNPYLLRGGQQLIH